MSPLYKAPRGTADVLPSEQPLWRYVTRTAEAISRRFGYSRIETPVFEETGLFIRGVGSGTDIVEKEMYTFRDRGGDDMTLRPEGTAPVCRAYLEHGMASWPQPVRLFYVNAPIFRYERPQAGRYRQHHQFGCEAIGDAGPMMDVEIISIAWEHLATLGLKGLSLHINNIGDSLCRPEYMRQLRSYYRSLLPHLCGDCQQRYERNTLRLLDCKKPTCQPHLAQAPTSTDSLCGPCLAHWEQVLACLQGLGIPHQVNPRLVRGLDYYTRTVFEIHPPKEGAQSALASGGRYDGLMEQLGGPATPGVGFGSGIERAVLALKEQHVPIPAEEGTKVFMAYVGRQAAMEALKMADRLRKAGVATLLASEGKSLKAQMRQADAAGASHVLILGEDELKAGAAVVRDLRSKEQRRVPLGDLVTELARV
jgi:histidyl-tRNA synthetase